MRTLCKLAASSVLGLILVSGGAGVMSVMSGCEEKVSEDNYSSINTGMTLPDVERIMGGKGEVQKVEGMSVSGAGMASSGSSTNNQVIYVWKSGRKEISVTMMSNKVAAKGKAGF